MYEEALKIIIPFPRSYLCEMGLSTLAFMKDEYGNRMEAEQPMRFAIGGHKSVNPLTTKLITFSLTR